MKFYLRVYDNFHYQDEDEAYENGQYDTYEQAIVGAKSIVDRFFRENWKPGMKPDDLLVQFSLYGEDPIILPNEPGENEIFSAHTYAGLRVVEFCKTREQH